MKVKMPWLKSRLRQIDKTPAALARHLQIEPPRVYEMIGGRRHMQPDEIGPTAQFLEWPISELLAKLPEAARIVPSNTLAGNGATPPAQQQKGITANIATALELIPVVGTARPHLLQEKTERRTCGDSVLTGETSRYVRNLPALQGRNDVLCLYHHGTTMAPWRRQGELVLFEVKRPPQEHDYVVIYLVCGKEQPTPVIIRQLIQVKDTKLKLRQHNPEKDSDMDMAKVANMYRVLSWDDCVR